MSRRLPASSLALAFFLLAGSLLLPLLATPAAAFGERPYEANQVISGNSHLDVYSGQKVAQSFSATETYVLLNVSLRLRNLGSTTDSINVTVRADNAGVPDTAYLAGTNVGAGGAVGQVNVAFVAPPVLTKGQQYWIVTIHTGVLAEAYEWHHSNADTYASGKAMVDTGPGWTDALPSTDLYFLTFGRELAANLTLDIPAPGGNPAPDQTATFTLNVSNAGTQSARWAWVNLTLSSGLSYDSDTAAAAGSTTPFPAFTFGDVANGPHPFTVTVRVDVGVEPGTVLTLSATMDWQDAAGAPRPRASDGASLTVGYESKQLYLAPGTPAPPNKLAPARPTGGLAQQTNLLLTRGTVYNFDLGAPLTRALRVEGLAVTLYLDSENHDAKDLDVNLTLMGASGVPFAYYQQRVRTNNFDDFELFTFSFAPFDRTYDPGLVPRLRIVNLGSSGANAILAMNSTYAPSRLDLTTTTYVRIDAFQLRDGTGLTTVWSSKDALVVWVNASDPFGVDEIVAVRINVTNPTGGAVADWVPMGTLLTDPTVPAAWRLYEYTVPAALANGTYQVRVTAIESNGVIDVAEGTALVRSPQFSLVKLANVASAKGGDRVTYTVWYNNTGTGPAARVWLNDSLPSGVNFLASSDEAARTGAYNWTWGPVGPGSGRLDIEVQVRGGVTDAFITNAARLEFVDEKGHAWSPVLATHDLVIRGPVLAFTTTPSLSGVHANQILGITFRITNSGDVAQTLWLNVTLPAELGYVSDTSVSLGGTRTVAGNLVRYVFSDMPATTWTFTMTTRAAGALAPGTLLKTASTLNYTNTNGLLLPAKNAEADVTALRPVLGAGAIIIPAPIAEAGTTFAAFLEFSNTGNEAASAAWVNVTLDPYLTLVNASVAPAGTAGTIRFSLSAVGAGLVRVYLNLSVLTTVPDRRSMSVNGTIDYADGYGNVFPTVGLAPDVLEALGPRFVLSVSPALATVEAGTAITFTIFHANAGSATAGDVWLNLTLPATFVYVADDASGTRTVAPPFLQWQWTDVAPGPGSFSLTLRARPTATDGTSADLDFELGYTDVAGRFRNTSAATVPVSFVSSWMTVSLEADRSEVLAGNTFTYTLRVRNEGSATAKTVWLLDRVDDRLVIVSFTSRVRGEGAPNLNWTFSDLAPGQEEVVVLVVRVLEGTPARTPVSNVIEATFTNSVGDILGYVRSTPVTITVVADLIPVFSILFAGIPIGAAAVFLVIRRRKIAIEEVFLVYRDGVLMYHLSRSLVDDKDEDVLSGMLTAVQEFVRDSFRYGQHRELHRLDFGDYRIIIERGKTVYLAVVYSGPESSAIRRKVRTTLDHIETKYGSVLKEWDGDMDKVVGARDAIRDLLFRPNGKLPWTGPRDA